MLETIKEKYCQDSKFIEIDNIKDYLSSLTLDEKNKLLKDIYVYNKKVYKELDKQNKEYLKVLMESKIQKKEISINKFQNIKNKLSDDKIYNQTEDKALKLDISFYLDFINQVKDLDEIFLILPNKENDLYNDIINSILIHFVQDMVIIKKLMKETDELDSDMIYYKQELNKIINKINYIKQYDASINSSFKSPLKKENHVVFLTTDNLKNCFMNDLIKNVDEHYYENIKQLLISIKDGSFKNVKSFVADDLLTGVFEVRGHQTRIIFKRLRQDVYIVMQVFVKKVQNTHYYRTTLISRNSLYKLQEKSLLSKINDDKYLLYNDQVYDDIINYLEEHQKGASNAKVNRKNK